MADEYSIVAAFSAIENELIASMIRNLRRHKNEEIKEDKQWAMWQTEELKALEKYRRSNEKKFGKEFSRINAQIEGLIMAAKDEGEMEQEIAILKAIKNGLKAKKASAGATAEFFKLNERKLEALIKVTKNDMKKAETAVLRMANDQYRKIIFNAQVYANTGAGTYESAVDMATKDFLSAGLNCVEYANGARHTLSDYARMAIRTASKRAYLQGEGQKRQEWGISTVIVNKRGNPCPKCLPFCGKILIDDVWSGGSRKDGSYPLMSAAVRAGLYHPNCKDSHTTYFAELDEEPEDTYTKKEIEQIENDYKKEQQIRYIIRQETKYNRLADYSLDEENQLRYRQKEKIWRHVRLRTGELDSREYAADKNAKQFIDITEEWTENAVPGSGKIEELGAFTVNGISYIVDGINVKQNNSKRELEVAKILQDTFGGDIQFVPEVNGKYSNVKTPDYIYNGDKYDLKEIRGMSKDALRNAIHKKAGQAENFIIDVTESKLELDEINRQAENVFISYNTGFVKTIILLKGQRIIRVLKRK